MRRAADRDRARAVGAHAERNASGVAVHDLDALERHAEPVRDDLREGRFVALAVTVRAGEHGDRAGRMHANLARLRRGPRARARRARNVRRREPARLDTAGVAQAAPLAVLSPIRRRRASKPFTSASLERAREDRFVVARVVGEADRRRVRKLADEVVAAHLGRIDASSRARRFRRAARPRRSPPAGPRRDRHRPERCW